MDHEDSKTQRLEHFTVDNLPIEIWEKILMHLDCDSWNNLSKTFDIIQGVIHSIKKVRSEIVNRKCCIPELIILVNLLFKF